MNHDRTDLRLREGPLEDLSEYRLEKIKFHFGCEGEDGSEHAIDGKRKLAEVSRKPGEKEQIWASWIQTPDNRLYWLSQPDS